MGQTRLGCIASPNADLGHSGSGFIASPVEIGKLGPKPGTNSRVMSDEFGSIPLLVGQTKGKVFKNLTQPRVKPTLSYRVKMRARDFAILGLDSGTSGDCAGVGLSSGGSDGSLSALPVGFEVDAMQLYDKGKEILEVNGVNVAADGALSKVSPEDTAAASRAIFKLRFRQ